MRAESIFLKSVYDVHALSQVGKHSVPPSPPLFNVSSDVKYN